MDYLIAIVGLAGACVLWFGVQHWAGVSDELPCDKHGGDCEGCKLEHDGCE